MKYEFTYKTANGERHVDFIRARSSDDAFRTLREKGIKPIRVIRAKPNGIFERLFYFATSITGIAVTIAVLAVGVSIYAVCSYSPNLTVRPKLSGHINYDKLTEEVELVKKEHEDAFDAIDFELIRNYALIARVDNLQSLYAEISKARMVIGNTRERLRAIFSKVSNSFAGDSTGFSAAQALYGEIMSKVDVDEAQLESDEAVIALLDENRNKWKVVKGKVIFSESTLKTDFELLSQSVDPATARWRKDFTPKVSIESKPFEIPMQ